jgi:hypothetical protein
MLSLLCYAVFSAGTGRKLRLIKRQRCCPCWQEAAPRESTRSMLRRFLHRCICFTALLSRSLHSPVHSRVCPRPRATGRAAGPDASECAVSYALCPARRATTCCGERRRHRHPRGRWASAPSPASSLSPPRPAPPRQGRHVMGPRARLVDANVWCTSCAGAHRQGTCPPPAPQSTRHTPGQPICMS